MDVATRCNSLATWMWLGEHGSTSSMISQTSRQASSRPSRFANEGVVECAAAAAAAATARTGVESLTGNRGAESSSNAIARAENIAMKLPFIKALAASTATAPFNAASPGAAIVEPTLRFPSHRSAAAWSSRRAVAARLSRAFSNSAAGRSKRAKRSCNIASLSDTSNGTTLSSARQRSQRQTKPFCSFSSICLIAPGIPKRT
mmetsp:Transcript_40146/g.110363  ORF Transcript_40146/g.110363 Transcript_40146/m.110363 type:complete len:203 (-) Transcript_40146:190-798(-)